MKRVFGKRRILTIIFTIIFAAILYYIFLPPINIHSTDFYIFTCFVIGFAMVCELTTAIDIKTGGFKGSGPSRILKLLSALVIGIIAIILGINIVLSPLFNSSSYASRITIIEGSKFEEDVDLVDFSKVPLLDRDSTEKIGDRVMGEMTDLVSQFYVSDIYTQINYNDKIARVTPLEYNGIIKYFTNRSEGVKGYIVVNSVNGEASLVRLDKGMKYMPSAMFNENLYRKLRFSYPTEIFGQENFELDNDGNPYWIVPTIKYSGVGLKEEITGVVVLDPITGKTTKYSVGEIPSWIDHVYNADIIIEQVNDWGKYREGFLNSLFGQKNVVATTTGYNYVAQNDDLYLYTGITSVSTDESNLGFILTNMRTKETHYYLVPGAEEYSAMASAEGQIQEMSYVATFPLLINLNGRATYLLSLKDNAGLVKRYAFVDVQNYQKVVVTDSSKGIEYAAKSYLSSSTVIDDGKAENKTIKIKTFTSAIIDNNSYYYIEDSNNNKYRVSIKVNEDEIPFLKVGDKIEISYYKTDGLIEIVKLKH